MTKSNYTSIAVYGSNGQGKNDPVKTVLGKGPSIAELFRPI